MSCGCQTIKYDDQRQTESKTQDHKTSRIISSIDEYFPEMTPRGSVNYICYVAHTKIDLNPDEDSTHIDRVQGALVRHNDDYIILWDLERMILSLMHSDLPFSKFINTYKTKSNLKSKNENDAIEEASILAKSRFDKRKKLQERLNEMETN